MLGSLFPRFHKKFLCLPLLGPIVDGFDDWLAANNYATGSRKHIIRVLPRVDADLRHRRVRDVADLTHAMLIGASTSVVVYIANHGTDPIFCPRDSRSFRDFRGHISYACITLRGNV